MKKLSYLPAFTALMMNAFAPSAYAVTITTDTADNIVLTAGDPTLTITSTGSLDTNSLGVPGGDESLPAVSGSSFSGYTVNVNTAGTTSGIRSRGITGPSTIDFTDSLVTVNINSGLVRGLAAGDDEGIINLQDSRAGTNTITNAGVIESGNGSGGNAINYNNTVNDATLIVNNSGEIRVDPNSTAIRFNDTSSGSILQVNNSGILSGTDNAIEILNADATTASTVSNTAGGTIEGDITKSIANLTVNNDESDIIGNFNLNSGTTTINNTDTATIVGDINAGTGTTTLNNTSASLTGDYNASSGASIINNTASAVIAGNIVGSTGDLDVTMTGLDSRINGNVSLGTNSSSTYNITDGVFNGSLTFGNAAQTLTLAGTGGMNGSLNGTGNVDIGQTAYVNLNTTTLNAAINGTIPGGGSLLIANGQSVNVLTGIGVTRSLGVLDMGDNSNLFLNNTGGKALNASTIVMGSGANLQVGAITVNGNIRGKTDGAGSVTLNNSVTLGGSIGASGAAINTLNLVGGTTTNAAANNIYANTVNVRANSTLNSSASIVGTVNMLAGADVNTSNNLIGNVNMSDGSVLTLANGANLGTFNLHSVNGDTASHGTINTTSGIQQINSNIGDTNKLSAFNVGSGSFARIIGQELRADTINISSGTLDLRNFSAGNVLEGNLTTNGAATLALNTGSHDLTGNMTLTSGDTLTAIVNSSSSVGNISVSGAASNTKDTLLKLTVGSTSTPIGTRLTLVDGGAGSTLKDIRYRNIEVDDNGTNHIGKFEYNAEAEGDDLILAVNRYKVRKIVHSPNGSTYEAVIADDTPTGELEVLQTYLDSNGPTDDAKAVVMNSAVLQNDNAMNRIAFDTVNTAGGLIGNRLNSLRAPGRSAGDGVLNDAVWAEAFGMTSNQGNTGSYEGYKSGTSGFGFGIDRTCDNGFTLGLAGIYAHSKVKAAYSNKRTEIDNYQINLYGGQTFENFFVNALVGVGFNQYDTTRKIDVVQSVAQGDFNGRTYVARAEIGSNQRFGNDFIFTPTFMLTAARNTFEGYSEEGAGTLNIAAKYDSTNFLEARVGSALSKNFKISKDNLLTPTIFASYGYDFAGQRQKATGNFVGQTTTFGSAAAKISQASLRLGAGIKMYNVNDFSVSAEYSFDHRIGYNSHMGSLRARYNF